MKYVYPAVFTEDKDGGYVINFPDLEGCYTQGDDLEDGMEMAEDVLCLVPYDMEIEGRSIPAPSNIKEVQSGTDDLVTLIRCDTTTYRLYHNNQAIKKTLTIPQWLNEEAIARGINFSSVLQEGLKEKLGL